MFLAQQFLSCSENLEADALNACRSGKVVEVAKEGFNFKPNHTFCCLKGMRKGYLRTSYQNLGGLLRERYGPGPSSTACLGSASDE